VIEELDELAKRGAGHAENLRISDAHTSIFPWHFAETAHLIKGTSDGENIGTTGRGIGPAIATKSAGHTPCGLATFIATFALRLAHRPRPKSVLEVLYPPGEFKPLVAADIVREYTAHAERLRPYVCDTTDLLLAAAETASGSCSKAPKARCWMSITALIHSSPASK